MCELRGLPIVPTKEYDQPLRQSCLEIFTLDVRVRAVIFTVLVIIRLCAASVANALWSLATPNLETNCVGDSPSFADFSRRLTPA